MRNRFTKTTLALLTASIALGVSTHIAQAAPDTVSNIASFFGLDLWGMVTQLIALMVNMLLSITSWLIAIAGFFLNFSINLTLHIKAFVDATPAIFTTWKAIRDISSLFIIFFLLYAALQLILGLRDAKFGGLIKNIIIAGALVNFSFFFAGLGIDLSNVVSMQLYNAIAPMNDLNAGSSALTQTQVKSWLGDGGLSDIFMQHLQITSVWNTKLAETGTTANKISAPFKIIFMGVVGILIELTAAASFFAASVAFVYRFVILLVLLAFSPIWFVAFLLPDLKEYSSEWLKTYKSMLIFMPVYLLLMYLALNVLTTSTVLQSGYEGNLVSGTGDAWYSNLLVLGVNAFIIMFLLNMPLLAAVKLGGTATKWIDKSGFTGKAIGSLVGRRTLGRAAYSLGNSRVAARVASISPLAGQMVSSGLTKVAKSNFGGDKKSNYVDKLKEKTKAQEDLHKNIANLDRSKYSSEQEYQDALKVRRGYQEDYRKSLPWKGVVGGAIGFMVDNRANRQTAMSLTDETGLEGNKVELEKVKTRLEKLRGEARTVQSAVEIRNLEIQQQELQASVNRASGKKKQKDISALASAVAEEGKASGGGEEKPEKKADGGGGGAAKAA
jgi:hypothetical protein